MRLTEILSPSRIVLDPEGRRAATKEAALSALAELVAADVGLPDKEILTPLLEREKLQSTGIGEGVAIPHCSLGQLEHQVAALLLCRAGIPFDAIDGANVQIVFAVLAPKKAASDHLKILAKISRLLRSPETRRRLLDAATPEQAFALIEEHDDRASIT
jgi:nitrogen PTS system EIIA component